MTEDEMAAIRAAMLGAVKGKGRHGQWAGLAQQGGGKGQKEV